jgi:two-component system chemotaxis response regulator CheB
MPSFHVPFFAELVGRGTDRRVVVGYPGATLERDTVYIAPGDRHMLVCRVGGQLQTVLDDGAPEHNCRPAVDPMFRSLALACGAAAIAVVHTGMGADGALGAVALRAAGAPVIVQDRETSVVWGMPGAVVAAGAASEQAPGPRLAETIGRWCALQRAEART